MNKNEQKCFEEILFKMFNTDYGIPFDAAVMLDELINNSEWKTETMLLILNATDASEGYVYLPEEFMDCNDVMSFVNKMKDEV